MHYSSFGGLRGRVGELPKLLRRGSFAMQSLNRLNGFRLANPIFLGGLQNHVLLNERQQGRIAKIH